MIPAEIPSAFFSTFILTGLAEIGDKSQIVRMTLAARHCHWPAILGATAAFLVLNALAVMCGAGVAAGVPERLTAGIVAVLFGAFGIHALYRRDDGDSDDVVERPGHGIFLSTMLLIFLAEFGDKTQNAVAGLAVYHGAYASVAWRDHGAGNGIGARRLGWHTLLQRLPHTWLPRISGGIFLVFALIVGWQAFA